jgi:hypothetical protein
LLGDVLRDRGDLAGALDASRAGLAIRERLLAQEPTIAKWQRELAVSCGNVAAVLLDTKDGDVAEARRLITWGISQLQTLAKVRLLVPFETRIQGRLERLRHRFRQHGCENSFSVELT